MIEYERKIDMITKIEDRLKLVNPNYRYFLQQDIHILEVAGIIPESTQMTLKQHKL